MTKKLIIALWIGIVVASLGAEQIRSGASITNIEIKGVSDTDKIMKHIGIKKGDPYSPEAIARAKATIIKMLEAKGLYGTTVNTSIEPINDGVSVIFDVNKGEKIKIRKVTFIGNKHIPTSELEKNIVNKEGGWLSWIPIIGGGGTAMPEQLPYDQMRIREVYLENGYLDAKVGEPLMKVDFSNYKADITYVIQEGEPYKVSTVRIEGNVPGVDIIGLQQKLKLKPGKIFNVKNLRHDIKKIHRVIGDHGYAFAQVEPVFKKNPKTHTVSVIYKVTPNKKVYINDVIITGNTKTLDYVIRRYIYLAPGDLYSYTDLDDTKKELQRTGFFEKVVVKPQRVSEDKINIVVEVTEAQTGSISGGIGYGSYDGLMFNAGLSEKNLFGTGIAGSLNIEYGKKSHDYSLSFTDPRVFNTLFSLSVGVYDSSNKYNYNNSGSNNKSTEDYTVNRTGGWISVGRKIDRNMHFSIGYSYSNVDYHDYTPLDINGSDPYESYKKSSIIGAFTFDNTDDFYVPREGYYSKISLEYAGVGGDAKFWKTDFKFAAFYGLEDDIDYDLILRYKLHAGYMNDDGYTPVAEMYKLGGARSGIRGFAPGSISPRYIDSVTGNEYIAGGNEIFVNSIEASIPLEMITRNMRLTGFVDFGMIKNTIYKSVDEKDWMKRASAGAQIEWRSPFGPINLVFAYPLNKKSGDDTSVFEFTMGSKF